MKKLLCLALLLPSLLFATQNSVEIQWIFLSSTEPLLRGQFSSSNHNVPLGILALAGVFTSEQLTEMIEDLDPNKSSITKLPIQRVSSGSRSTDSNLTKVDVTPKFLGSKEHLLRIPKLKADHKTEDIGYLIQCTPSIGPDGYAIDLSANISLTTISGYEDTFISDNLVGALSKNPKEVFSDNSPRIRTVRLSKRKVSTKVTLYDGQAAILVASEGSITGRYDYIIAKANLTEQGAAANPLAATRRLPKTDRPFHSLHSRAWSPDRGG